MSKKLNFKPLDRSELEELMARLKKSGKVEIRLSDIYNGPRTRARLANIARRAVFDLVSVGLMQEVGENRWRFVS